MNFLNVTAYGLIILIVSVVVFSVMAITIGGLVILRIRRRRGMYIEIPAYSTPKKLSLKGRIIFFLLRHLTIEFRPCQ